MELSAKDAELMLLQRRDNIQTYCCTDTPDKYLMAVYLDRNEHFHHYPIDKNVYGMYSIKGDKDGRRGQASFTLVYPNVSAIKNCPLRNHYSDYRTLKAFIEHHKIYGFVLSDCVEMLAVQKMQSVHMPPTTVDLQPTKPTAPKPTNIKPTTATLDDQLKKVR